MAEFVVRKPYDPVAVRPHVIGSVVEKQYRLTRDLKGNCVYTEVGEINIQKEIDSYRDGCSLEAQLQRMQFVPTREKIQMLQQREDGVSADMSSIPTDGTAARIMIDHLKSTYPKIFERISAGENPNQVLADVFAVKKKAVDSEAKKVESEVNTNG